ncbi:MAG: DUF971 domain-containing protein [Rhabdochlamydiaceae bacterium]
MEVVRISILWTDGHRSIHGPFNLRSACPCAMCKGEPGIFGKYYSPTRPEIQKDVRSEEIQSVGRYGLKISWTDGHDLGIYTFGYLRRPDAKSVARNPRNKFT